MNFKQLSAIFLVSGTSIGGGMLAQPVAAGTIGFLPSFVVMAFVWVFMTTTGLILAEVCLWEKNQAHMITLSQKYLGFPGKVISWITYLFIAYLSLVAYMSGGGDLVTHYAESMNLSVAPWLATTIFGLGFGLIIEVGSKFVGKVNSILFISLLVCYLIIVVMGVPLVSMPNLLTMHPEKSFSLIPLFLTSFSFQMIIPNIAHYVDYDRKALRRSIVLGTMTSFVFYTVWNFVVLGSAGPDSGLIEAYAEGRLPIEALSAKFSFFMQAFSFLAVVTSFIGISWGLFELLADGLKVRREGSSRWLLWALVMFPTLAISIMNPGMFIGALEITGSLGDTILNGLIPIGILWVGLKRLGKVTEAKWLQHPATLSLLIAFAFFVIGMEAWG